MDAHRQLGDEAHAASAERRRVAHEVVGVGHIVALGDASASLGLIATLVFSCGVSILFSSTIDCRSYMLLA